MNEIMKWSLARLALVAAQFAVLIVGVLATSAVRAECARDGTLYQPTLAAGTTPTVVYLQTAAQGAWAFTVSDPTLKVLLAVWEGERLRLVGDAATCPPVAEAPVPVSAGNLLRVKRLSSSVNVMPMDR